MSGWKAYALCSRFYHLFYATDEYPYYTVEEGKIKLAPPGGSLRMISIPSSVHPEIETEIPSVPSVFIPAIIYWIASLSMGRQLLSVESMPSIVKWW